MFHAVINVLVSIGKDDEYNRRFRLHGPQSAPDGLNRLSASRIGVDLSRQVRNQNHWILLVHRHPAGPAHGRKPTNGGHQLLVLRTIKFITIIPVLDEQHRPISQAPAFGKLDAAQVPGRTLVNRRGACAIFDSRRWKDASRHDGHLVPNANAKCIELRRDGLVEAELAQALVDDVLGVDVWRLGSNSDHIGSVIVRELSFECLIWEDLANFGWQVVGFLAADVDKRKVWALQYDLVLYMNACYQ